MALRVVGVIPARWGSTRLPGKMLADLGGKPLIVRTMHAAQKSKVLDELLVATDDQRIVQAVLKAGGTAVLTRSDLPSGSDRVLSAIKEVEADIVVNIQGDEPLIPPEVIDKSVNLLLENSSFAVSTAATKIQLDQLENPNIVKVVTDIRNRALYFSRSAIPYPRNPNPHPSLFKRHVGIYVYHRKILEAFCSWPVADLEECESLEQLRLLAHGVPIGVADVKDVVPGVDTLNDLERVRACFTEGNSNSGNSIVTT